MRDGRDVVEMTHDRIRDTIVAQLPPAMLREHHGHLARALEDIPGEDGEAVALHWLAAGDGERAAHFAEDAGQHAAAKLAFDQSARLFRLALEHTRAPPASPDLRRLRARLAEVLQFGGRYEESARAYLAAAEGAPAEQRVDVSAGGSRAAAQRRAHGRRSGDAPSGARRDRDARASLSRSPRCSGCWSIACGWRVMGLRFKERAPDAVRR